MRDTMKRERKVNVERLTVEQAEFLSQEIGNKIREIVDKACEDANKILNIYGMKTLMQIVIEPKDKT